jgi:uncharacterized cupin superfamily protein
MTQPAALFTLLLPQDAHWRESNIMKIPNTNLGEQLGSEKLGARLWRMPPHSANTWHRHPEQEELYLVLEGTGRIRVGETALTVPRHGAVLVRPSCLRQVFNDTDQEVLWLILGAPRNEPTGDRAAFYPEDPRTLPPELEGRTWPPK